MTKHQSFQIAPGELLPNPWNSNVVAPEMEARIDASVEKLDFFKPIIVRELGDGRFEILGGEHRMRSAIRLGRASVPVFSVGRITDTEAKAITVADNARYGEDDALKLSAILADISDVETFLPYSEADLAGIFGAKEIDFSQIGIEDDEQVEAADDLPTMLKNRPALTHELMRFKVPVEDREMIQKLVDMVIKTRGLVKEEDSLVAAGMALVEIAKVAKETM